MIALSTKTVTGLTRETKIILIVLYLKADFGHVKGQAYFSTVKAAMAMKSTLRTQCGRLVSVICNSSQLYIYIYMLYITVLSSHFSTLKS